MNSTVESYEIKNPIKNICIRRCCQLFLWVLNHNDNVISVKLVCYRSHTRHSSSTSPMSQFNGISFNSKIYQFFRLFGFAYSNIKGETIDMSFQLVNFKSRWDCLSRWIIQNFCCGTNISVFNRNHKLTSQLILSIVCLRLDKGDKLHFTTWTVDITPIPYHFNVFFMRNLGRKMNRKFSANEGCSGKISRFIR